MKLDFLFLYEPKMCFVKKPPSLKFIALGSARSDCLSPVLIFRRQLSLIIEGASQAAASIGRVLRLIKQGPPSFLSSDIL